MHQDGKPQDPAEEYEPNTDAEANTIIIDQASQSGSRHSNSRHSSSLRLDKPQAPPEEHGPNTDAEKSMITVDQASQSGSRHSSSRHKGSSRSSFKSMSSASVAAARARAQAEAARTRAFYAQKENAIKLDKVKMEVTHQLEKARLDADLEMLHHEKEAAAALAQAEVLEAAAAGSERDNISEARRSVSLQSKAERTSEYVRAQAMELFGKQPKRSTEPTHESKPTLPVLHSLHVADSPIVADSKQHISTDRPPQPCDSTQRNERRLETSNFHPSHPSQRESPQVRAGSTPFHQPEPPGMLDFAKYLARRELVITGLTQFDDRPESFRAWRSAFLGAIEGLDITAGEELDLLTKWLGKESSDHVRRLRSVHVNDPSAALKMAWQRLLECYGAPEIIEKALFKKLDSFPKISNRDHVKLRELGDLLMELRGS